MAQIQTDRIGINQSHTGITQNISFFQKADGQASIRVLASEQMGLPLGDGTQWLPESQQETVMPTEAPLSPDPEPSGLALWIVLIAVAIVAAVSVIIVQMRKNKRIPITAKTEIDRTQPENVSAQWQIAARQTIGKRENQEDSLCYSDIQNPQQGILCAVADGVGGMSDGQVASGAAAKLMLAEFRQGDPSVEPSRRLLNLVADAHREVLRLNQGASNASGSTLVSILIMDRDLFFASVGDSRIYLYRDGGLIQLNREHVLGPQADEQLLLGLRGGDDMPDAKRRKAITAYLGKEDLRLIDRNIHPIKLYPGDRVLLMSDGVFGTLTEAQMINALQADVATAAESMIQLVNACQKTYQDNATVLIIGA